MNSAGPMPMIDRAALDDIRQALDADAVRHLAEIYADTARQLCARIRAAQASGQVDEMRNAAHSLKGGSQQICATYVAQSARAIENACHARRPQDVGAHVAALAGLIERTLRELRALVAADRA